MMAMTMTMSSDDCDGDFVKGCRWRLLIAMAMTMTMSSDDCDGDGDDDVDNDVVR